MESKVESFDLRCEACEKDYTFAQYVTDEDEAKGVYCRCPNCGLPGSDQLTAHRYEKLDGKMPGWFQSEKEHFLRQTMPHGYFEGGRIKHGDKLNREEELVQVPNFKPKGGI